MFWRLGFVDDKRPVLAPTIEKDVCTRPVTGLICAISASVYVVFNLLSCLQASTSSANSLPSAAKTSRTSAPVAYAPVFVFFPPLNPNSSNNTSPSCLGDPILKSWPANRCILSDSTSRRFAKSVESSDKTLGATAIPLASISTNTPANGRSSTS